MFPAHKHAESARSSRVIAGSGQSLLDLIPCVIALVSKQTPLPKASVPDVKAHPVYQGLELKPLNTDNVHGCDHLATITTLPFISVNK